MRRTLGFASAFLLGVILVLGEGNAAPTFGSPKTMPNTGGAFEPGIDVAPDGTIFVNGPPGIPSHSKLWRSTNGGAAYTAIPFPTPWGRLPGGGDSDVVTGTGGRLYFLDLWAGSNSITRSNDHGTTWDIGTPITTLPVSDRQWMELGKPNGTEDTVHVVYALIQEPRQVMIATSTDSGVTWLRHVPAPALLGARAYTGPLVSDRNGFLAFTWEDNGVFSVAYSLDDGASWASKQIATGVLNIIPTLARSGDNLYAAWVDRTSYAVMESHSADRGVTWSTPATLSSGGTNIFVWLDARDDKVAVTWYGSDGAVADPNSNAGPWFLKYTESLDAGASYASPVKAAPGAVKTTPICLSGLACMSGRELGDFLQVVIDSAGNALIAYVDVPAGSPVKVVAQTG